MTKTTRTPAELLEIATDLGVPVSKLQQCVCHTHLFADLGGCLEHGFRCTEDPDDHFIDPLDELLDKHNEWLLTQK